MMTNLPVFVVNACASVVVVIAQRLLFSHNASSRLRKSANASQRNADLSTRMDKG